METTIALIIAGALLIVWATYKIRQAGEAITRAHEDAAAEEEILRRRKHDAELARKKAMLKVAPILKRPLTDYRNPTQPGE